MARFQTRKSLSLNGDVYAIALQHARANDMTLPELVTAALRAFIELPQTTHQTTEIAARAIEARDRSALHEPKRPGFCAMCLTETADTVRFEGADICRACDGEHPRSGRYSFAGSGGAGPGIGEGNRRAGYRG